MPRETLKKIDTSSKVPAKRGRKPLPKPTVEAKRVDAPKRSYKKTNQKVNLQVRSISNDKKPIDTIKKSTDKEKLVISDQDLKQKKVIKKQIAKNDRIDTKSGYIPDLPKVKIIKERTEKDKKALMWIGVSFFMILIAIFWFYSAKESIKKSQIDKQLSEKAKSWNKMADELSNQIDQIKTGVKSIQDFASTSEENSTEDTNNSDLFRDEKIGTSVEPIDPKVLDDLKRDLEIKTGVVEPSDADYYFILNEEEKKHLLESLPKIKVGDSLNEVRGLLGEADFSMELKNERGLFVSQILSYNVKIFEKDTSNEIYDRYVDLEFDKEGILTKIVKHLE